MFYKSILRPILFRFSPERIHTLTYTMLRVAFRLPLTSALLRRILLLSPPELQREFWGLHFPNPIGLPAGFDKEALLADRVRNLGFGFTEVGTVTPRPQPGNPKPRLFRLPKDQALINRMGFNSCGVEQVAKRLASKRKHHIPIGGNIGKNTATANEEAPQDYLLGMRSLYPLVDFFVVNISCPNVKNLCELQSDTAIHSLLTTLTQEREQQDLYRPILLKISPDQTEETLKHVVHLSLEQGIDGFIVANTTTSRAHLNTCAERIEEIGNGGLSGKPLFAQTLRTVKWAREAAGAGVPIIGVGGIGTGEEALQVLQAGASLIQLYTGFIYNGPLAVRSINRYLHKHHNEIPKW